jgi:hypothetical protein
MEFGGWVAVIVGPVFVACIIVLSAVLTRDERAS